MNRSFFNLDPNQNISGGLALVLIGLMSVFLSWYAVDKSESVVDDVFDSPIVHIDQRRVQEKKNVKYESIPEDPKPRTQTPASK